MASSYTREQMEQVIQSGGSFLHDGRVITKIENLPPASVLAKGDPIKEAAATQSLEDKIAALQAELDGLKAPKAEPAVEEKQSPPEENPPKTDTVGSVRRGRG
jgi:hypothetical protein